MRGQDRLRPLEMGVAGQDHVGVVIAAADQRPLQGRQPLVDPVDRPADPQPQVGGHLIVSAAGGVQFSSHVAEPVDQRPLDVHVDVFQFGAEGESALLNFLADFLECLLNLAAFIERQQPDLGQHLGVCGRAVDVMRIQPPVEAHAFGELLDATVGRLLENSPPRFVGHTKLLQTA